MAFDLSTPEAQLAFKIAVSAQKTQDAKARLERQARNSVSAQLAPYGQSVDNFNSEFSSIYDPAANRQQAEARAMQRYVTGLPELLSQVQKERTANSRGSGGGSLSSQIPFQSQAFDPYAMMQYLIEASQPKTPRPVRDALPRRPRPPVTGLRPGSVAPTYDRTVNPTGGFG
jgi:hypothetical protein